MESPDAAEAYVGSPVRKDFSATARQRVANLVVGVPRTADGSINRAKAVMAVNTLSDDYTAAAVEALVHLTGQQIAMDGIPGSDLANDSVMASVKAKTRSKYPALASVADGGGFTEECLVEMFPQYFA